MECDRFVEEKVSGGDSRDLRGHVADCPACARDLEDYAEIRRLYREASVERWRGGVPRLRSPWASRLPVAAAAAMMVGILVLLMGSPSGPPRPPDPAPVFTRVHLAPWDRGEARIGKAMDDVWRLVENIERNSR